MTKEKGLVMYEPQYALESKRKIAPFVIFGLTIIYVFSPVDIIPDIPVIGWVDDGVLLSAATLHMLEKGFGIRSRFFITVLRLMKWTVIILGTIAIALFALLGLLIYRWFAG